MKQLLEDYQRRLKTIDMELCEYPLKAEKKYRLEIKASCYRTFITELERAIKAEEKVNY